MKSLASKPTRFYETIVTFDLRHSNSHPVEKNNVEIGPNDIPFEINDARKALALKFGVKKDFVQVGSFGRVNDRRKYGVVCYCGCRGNTRHIFLHTNQEDPSDFPACVCAPVGGSLRDALPMESTDQSSFVLDGNLIRADTCQIADLKPVTFLQLIHHEDVDISLLFHNDPGVETKYTLTVRNTDSVGNIKQKFVRRHAASLKAVNTCLSLSKECRILEDSCIPSLHTIDSDGNFFSEKITMPLTLHCHPTKSVLVEIQFHSQRFPVIVPRTSNFNDLRKEIAKVINKPHASLEYPKGLAWDDLVSQYAENQPPPCCVEVEMREALDVMVVVRDENSEKDSHVPVRLHRHDSLATLKNAVAAEIPVTTECLWFHTLVDGSIPQNDLPLIDFLEHTGKTAVLRLRVEVHRHSLALQVRDLKHKTSDCLLVDNAKERTLGELGQYLQINLGELVRSQVRAYHEKQFIHEDCGKSLSAAGIKNLQELIVHFASECQPRSSYKMCFTGDTKGPFHQSWIREIDGVPHQVQKIPKSSEPPPPGDPPEGFVFETTNIRDTVLAVLHGGLKIDCPGGSSQAPGAIRGKGPSGNSSAEIRVKASAIKCQSSTQERMLAEPWPEKHNLIKPATDIFKKQISAEQEQRSQAVPTMPPDSRGRIYSNTKPQPTHTERSFKKEWLSEDSARRMQQESTRDRSSFCRPESRAQDENQSALLSILPSPVSEESSQERDCASQETLASIKQSPQDHPDNKIRENDITMEVYQRVKITMPKDASVEQQRFAQRGFERFYNNTSIACPIQGNPDALDRAMAYVAENIMQDDWVKLGFHLGLNQVALTDFAEIYHASPMHQRMAGLNMWRQREGSEATVSKLIKYLEEKQLQNLAEDLIKFQTDNAYPAIE